MTHIERDPSPRLTPSIPKEFQWPTTQRYKCPTISLPRRQSFLQVVENRRSIRNFGKISIRELANYIAFSVSPRLVGIGPRENQSLRLSLSAGALHPVDVVLVPRGARRIMRYNPKENQLDSLKIVNGDYLCRFLKKSAEVLPDTQGSFIVLVGDLRKVSNLYENPSSLLWRDAGALLQTLALTAEAFRIS